MDKIQLRPTISTISLQENMSGEEQFQNNVLRPIIKLQHQIILSYFNYHLQNIKVNIEELNQTQILDLTQRLFKSDHRFKIEIRGLIIGLLTQEEFDLYLKMASGLNKRINKMIEQRVNSIFIS